MASEHDKKSSIPEQERLLSPEALAEEAGHEALERTVRPKHLKDFIGQKEMRERLAIAIKAAAKRSEALDHVLLSGPPGLGKTTMALIIAAECGVQLRATSGPVLERPGDLAALLTNLAEGDVLFIDEIHRLRPHVEEILYSAMEDRSLDIMIGEGPKARALKINLPAFTLVGATTRAGGLTAALRDRFGIAEHFAYYADDELMQIIERSAGIVCVSIDNESKALLARCARGTPRVANRLLRRTRDYVEVKADGAIDGKLAAESLRLLKINPYGLDPLDRRFLTLLTRDFAGRAVGIESLAASLGEERETLEEVVEPFLVMRGFMERSARGRRATKMSYTVLGEEPPNDV